MFDLSILSQYSFLVVALGTMILAIGAGAVGTITVLKGQSLIGDAIGHSSFPGVVLAFMIFMSRDSILLLLGAVSMGALAYLLINLIDLRSKLDLDAILAVILSSFFGLGLLLKSYIQGNEKFAGASQSSLQNYIFGQAAFTMKKDVYLIMAVALVALVILVLFFKEIKLYIFDETYARSIGLNTSFINFLILFMTMTIIGVGLSVVGSILISSLLIVPAISALCWSNDFKKVLILAGLTGAIGALVGTYLSQVLDGFSTGASIILVISFLAFVSMIFGPKGLIGNLIRRRRYK
ncbi:iron chelate uptake ABC transporter family permease subunit [Anaerococcus sp. AGMB09787]|uniref:metal ABC transporter permease n=1 Tax=Anaerococcus sp. AGMB09787 TaxID=2922869 RepID=UPI001FAED4AE|nr:iron chelate uptake ABC transporter family permease subunit [Anaerococcus sp. AGMB09787]